MATETKPLLSNTTYDRLKFLALVVLPALGAAYFGLAEIWDLPVPEKVTGSVTVLVTLLAVLLKVSDVQYNNSDAKYDASVIITEGPQGPVYALQFESPEQHLAAQRKDALLLKVK